MVDADLPYNATLWAVRSPQVMSCFRVHVDGGGHILSTSVFELNRLEGTPDFDAQVRASLRQRYGNDTTITVVADGGESYEAFRSDLHAGRSPGPPVAEVPSNPHTEGQQKLWEDPPR